MSITAEAIYEAGILKLLSPLPELPERTKVRLTIEPEASAASLPTPRFSAELLARIDRRREAIFKRCGALTDSADLIREGREKELE
jgi:predicted DNA-binding antitoxin AbrB/MazE fold protein